MQIDGRTIPANQTIEADICIIGAGAAGITLAREFIEQPFRVCLLESGGLKLDNSTQSLYQGRNVGLPYFPLVSTRLRFFGGTTNHWGGICRPMDDFSFERRDWIPHSGWPLQRSDLIPYFQPAEAICKLGSSDWDLKAWELFSELSSLPLNPDRVITRIAQVTPDALRSFASLYRDEIFRAGNITTYLNTNVTEIETDETAVHVKQLHVASLAGNRFSVVARIFVLAAGGIENPRILLLSNRRQPNGLGNQHDLVGRFFMDHPRCSVGIFRPSNPQLSVGFYDTNTVKGLTFKTYLALPAAVQSAEKLQDVQIRIEPVYDASYTEAKDSEGVSSLKQLRQALHKREMPDGFGSHLSNVIADLDDVLVAGYWWARIRGGSTPIEQINLTARIDPAPNPDSRITLSTERDRLGLNRVQLDWRLSASDKRSALRALELLGQELGRTGLGRLQITLSDDDTHWPEDLQGGSHHMGTTRMSENPKTGVVDKDCKVHGISNLYIAGSSVFPTAGSGTPTLMIVTLALRLADHIKRKMQ